MIATITIEGKVPRLNNAYSSGKHGKRFLNKEATEFKRRIKFKASQIGFKFDPYKEFIEVEIYFYRQNLLTEDRQGRRISKTSGDYDGLIKIVQDAVMSGLKIDDSFICKATIHKLPSDKDETIFIVKTGFLQAL